MLDGSENSKDFVLAEYREAANAYFKGVDIGYTGIKGYITINSLFAALIVGLSEPRGQSFAAAGDIIKFIPIVALFVFLAVLLILPHYFRHLKNCQRRCQEIEETWGGQLFKRLGQIADGQFKVGAVLGALMIFGTIGFIWIVFALRLRSFDYFLP